MLGIQRLRRVRNVLLAHPRRGGAARCSLTFGLLVGLFLLF